MPRTAAELPPLLTADEERELGRRVKAGGDDGIAAANELAERNLPLARFTARKYRFDLPLPDAIGAASLALTEAARAWNPDRGIRFSTYAVRAMRREINDERNRTVPAIPVPHGANYCRVCFRLGKSIKGVKPENLERTARLAEAARNVERHSVGILAEIVDHRDPIAPDLDPPPAIPFEALTEREKAVIERRFGLGGGDPGTLHEVGEAVGRTKQGVRIIESRALSKLWLAMSVAAG